VETIELSGIIGMIALAALAANFLVGICIWTKLNYQLPFQLSFLQLHKFTGYSAAIAIIRPTIWFYVGRFNFASMDIASTIGKYIWSNSALPDWHSHHQFLFQRPNPIRAVAYAALFILFRHCTPGVAQHYY
jgi:hypothetical protein